MQGPLEHFFFFQQCLLDSTGAYTEEAGSELAGRFVADADTENTGIHNLHDETRSL